MPRPLLTFAAAATAGLIATTAAHAGSALALARQQGCLGCHAVAAKIVGPSYQEVAAKYQAQADALTTLVQHIREGGSGRWGDVAMPPQKQLSPTQAKQLATWILSGAK